MKDGGENGRRLAVMVRVWDEGVRGWKRKKRGRERERQ